MNRSAGLCACALTLVLPTHARGQTVAAAISNDEAVHRPRLAGRVIHHFDFEESRINPFPVPRNWRRAQGERAAVTGTGAEPRPGFPFWNEAALDYRSAAAGEGSVMLPAAGGSTCLRLEPAVLPVFPGADYLVSAKVRTRGIEHARARVAARLLDASSRPITGSEVHTPLVGNEPAWRAIAVQVPGDFPDAAFMQIDLEVLQPVQFQAPVLGRHQVWPEDFAAAAWFDDVFVTQLPRIELSTQSPLNTLVAPQTPEISAFVRDLTGEVLRARLTLLDLDGHPIDTEERPLGAAEASWSWNPDANAFGWYRCTLEVFSGEIRVGDAALSLAWLPERPAEPSGERLGIVLGPDLREHVAETTTLIAHSAAGAVSLPIWTDSLTAETAPGAADALAPLIEACLRRATDMTFTLPRVPSGLAAECRVAPDDVPGVFSRDEEIWKPWVAPFADRFGQSVRQWQVGRPVNSTTRNLAACVGQIRTFAEYLDGLVPGPGVSVPWNTQEKIDLDALQRRGAPHGVEAAIPASMTPEAIAEFVTDWHTPAAPATLSVVLPAPAAGVTPREELVALTRRALAVIAAADDVSSPVPVAIPQPWTWTAPPRQRLEPLPSLPAWRCLADRLSRRRFTGELPIAPGVRAMIFSGAARGAPGLMVAWAEPAGSDPATIHAFLGDGDIVAYDLFGNPAPVPARETAAPGPPGLSQSRAHSISVTGSPIFVEGVDIGLARFVASMRLEPAFVSSAAMRHDIAIALSNPWDEPISGTLSVVEPGRPGQGHAGREHTWRMSPRQSDFSINPGQEILLPITLTFSAVEEAGVKDFVADVRLEGRPEYGRLRLRSAFEIGLEELRLELTSRIAQPDGDDVIVEAKVTNSGPAPVTLELTAFAPPGAGFSRSRASVSALEPGQSAIRRFAFPGGAHRLREGRILVGVQDTSSGARLNQSVLVGEPAVAGVTEEP